MPSLQQATETSQEKDRQRRGERNHSEELERPVLGLVAIVAFAEFLDILCLCSSMNGVTT